MTSINAGEEHSRYVGQVYQEHYGRLRHYFLSHLRGPEDADALVHETFRHFFVFMENRCWETYADDVPDYLMKIAGGVLFSGKAALKGAGRGRRLGVKEARRVLENFGGRVPASLRDGIRCVQLFLGMRPAGEGRTAASAGY